MNSLATDTAIAKELATSLGSLKAMNMTDRSVMSDILRVTLERHPHFWGVWTIWEPNALDGRDRDFVNHAGHDATGRYVPLWKRTRQGLRLEPNVGYEEHGVGDYYFIPMRRQRETALAPYSYHPADGVIRTIMSYVAPIFSSGRCVGVAGYDVPADDIRAAKRAPQPFEPETAASGLDTLSRREREVLEWVGEGKSNSEIALILGISGHTVKHHMEKIFAKLGVENRHAAMVMALQHAR